MKQVLILFSLCVIISCKSNNKERLVIHKDWKVIAAASLIIEGEINVPIEEISQALKTGKHHYVNIEVTANKILKGTILTKKIKLKYFTSERSHKPLPEDILKLNNKKCFLFLVYIRSESEDYGGYYFAGSSQKALVAYNTQEVKPLIDEINLQKEINLKGITDLNTGTDKKVKILIEYFFIRNKASEAYAKLEELGEAAVPSLIKNMHDLRDLTVKGISLRNKAINSFEGRRIYGPQKVVDVISAILQQITSERFFNIVNGSDSVTRKLEANAWKVWLHHKTELINTGVEKSLITPIIDNDDHDGIAYDYEIKHGLDPEKNDADLDLDDDGFSNIVEYYNGSDVNDPNSYPSISLACQLLHINGNKITLLNKLNGEISILSLGKMFSIEGKNGEKTDFKILKIGSKKVDILDNSLKDVFILELDPDYKNPEKSSISLSSELSQ